MRRFRFRLESVERLRAHEFETARRAWLALEREREARVLTIERLRERLEHGRDMLSTQLVEGSDSSRLSLAADAVVSAGARLERSVSELAEWMPTLDRARQVMDAARTRLRSLERLREKQAARHRADAERHEQAELDDLAQRNASRMGGPHARVTP